LVEHYNAHVPFVIGSVALVGAAFLLSTVRQSLAVADRGGVAQPELNDLDRVEREDALQVSAG
jgi:ACDE family multidrug resistance protein